MAEIFKLQVISPERQFYEGDVTMVEMVGTEGEMGIYKNHVPMTVIIAPGILRIHEEGGVKKAALHSGFAEILPDKITILAEAVEWPDEIDANRAEHAKVRAERRLKSGGQGLDIDRAELALRRSTTRLSLKE